MRSKSIKARIWAKRKEKLTAIAVVAFMIFAIGYTGNSDYQYEKEKRQYTAYYTP